MGSAWKSLRTAEKKAARVQRRVWLVQAMFWPAVIVVAAGGTIATVVAIRRRRAGSEIGAQTTLSSASPAAS